MTAETTQKPQKFKPCGALKGRFAVPGDKSISHRALMFSALAVGESRINGLLEGEDVLATAAALRAMGADISRDDDGTWHVHGVGVGGLAQPHQALDMGNSGTSTRLLMGLLASHDVTICMTGDASLCGRPMARVTEPLSHMGAEFFTSPDGTLPLMMRGDGDAVPLDYRLPMASAQVKSAIMLAGLNIKGVTRITEPVATRDHSERMLTGFGADIRIEENEAGERVIEVHGPCELQPQHIVVPGDPSSAAFFIVAALLVPGSDIVIENVGLNPTRAALIDLLFEMGGDIAKLNPRDIGGEPVADIHVRHSILRGVTVDPAIVPAMVDEFPIFFVAAAQACGETVTSGLEELRVKESDRLAVMATGLRQLGVQLEEREDGLIIMGRGGDIFLPEGQVKVKTHLDHRIAMSFAVAGLMTQDGVIIDDTSPIATSFPDFMAIMRKIGGLSA